MGAVASTALRQRLDDNPAKMLDGWTVSLRPFGFDEAHDATRPQDTPAFCEQAWPLSRREDGSEQTGLNQIKGVVIEVERLADIHDLEESIIQALYARHGKRMGDQRPAAINANDINALARKSHALHPVAGAPGQAAYMPPGPVVHFLSAPPPPT